MYLHVLKLHCSSMNSETLKASYRYTIETSFNPAINKNHLIYVHVCDKKYRKVDGVLNQFGFTRLRSSNILSRIVLIKIDYIFTSNCSSLHTCISFNVHDVLDIHVVIMVMY